jgi:hypothetical protein
MERNRLIWFALKDMLAGIGVGRSSADERRHRLQRRPPGEDFDTDQWSVFRDLQLQW